MAMAYQWKTGSHIKADPEEAAKVMNALADEGRLTAKDLVDVSRPEDAPLHGEFEWNDTVAAENWRCHQGRNIINAILIVDEEETAREPTRAFYNVEQSKPQYQQTTLLISTIDGRTLLKQKAKAELICFQRKYRTILAWCGVEQLIMDAVDQMEKAQ